MKLSSVINENNIMVNVEGATREEIYRNMLAASKFSLRERIADGEILQSLIRREDSTAIPYDKIALPHARMPEAGDLHIAVGILKKPVMLKKEDFSETSVVIMSLMTDEMSDLYLKSLAALVRFFSNAGNMMKVSGAVSGKEIFGIIKDSGITVNKVLTAGDIMTVAPTAVDINAPLSEALDIFARENDRSLPVTDGEGRLAGEINAEDVIYKFIPEYIFMMENLNFLNSFEPFDRIFKEENKHTVKEYVREPEMVVGEEVPVIQIAVNLARRRVSYIFVVDKERRLLGELTIKNIVTRVLRG